MSSQNPSSATDHPVCFVVMPISDMAGYDPGHFGRVYEHLLKPAIIDAGFSPLRADDTNKTDYIVISVVQKVVDSAIVLCDYSAKNPNVMYELGIRQAFNRPVVLVKDNLTEKVFDIQGLRYTEYDSSLRVDVVQKDISRICSAIRDTVNADTDGFNSVVHLAGLTPAKVPDKQEVSADTNLVLSAIAALDHRLNNRNAPTPQARATSFFTVAEGIVIFFDKTVAKIGDPVYDLASNSSLRGVLAATDVARQRIILKHENGGSEDIPTGIPDSKNLSGLPF